MREKEFLREPPQKPECQDYAAAKAEWLKENPNGNWDDDVPTRKKNSLAKNQMYHRGYSDLCDAIMDFRRPAK